MAKEFLEGRIRLLHDTEAHWNLVKDTFIPLAGEPCVTMDGDNTGRIKYGDGIHSWGELPYSNDNNHDKKSIISVNHVIQLVNFETATAGQIPIKSETGELQWVEPKVLSLGTPENVLEPDENATWVIPVAKKDAIGLVKSSKEIEVLDDGTMQVTKIPYTKVSGLTKILATNLDDTQFTANEDGIFSLTKVEASVVAYKDTTLDSTLDDLDSRTTWKEF